MQQAIHIYVHDFDFSKRELVITLQTQDGHLLIEHKNIGLPISDDSVDIPELLLQVGQIVDREDQGLEEFVHNFRKSKLRALSFRDRIFFDRNEALRELRRFTDEPLPGYSSLTDPEHGTLTGSKASLRPRGGYEFDKREENRKREVRDRSVARRIRKEFKSVTLGGET